MLVMPALFAAGGWALYTVLGKRRPPLPCAARLTALIGGGVLLSGMHRQRD